MASITIYKTTFAAWEEGADEPERIGEETRVLEIEDYRENFADWNDDETEWVLASPVFTAFCLLNGSNSDFWVSECSSSAGEVACGDNPWYSDEPYSHPYTGEMEEQSAHLNGFTPEEIAEIYKLVKGR
jgi:hypothetical protein